MKKKNLEKPTQYQCVALMVMQQIDDNLKTEIKTTLFDKPLIFLLFFTFNDTKTLFKISRIVDLFFNKQQKVKMKPKKSFNNFVVRFTHVRSSRLPYVDFTKHRPYNQTEWIYFVVKVFSAVHRTPKRRITTDRRNEFQ